MNRVFRIKEIDGNNDFKDVTFTVGTLKQYVLVSGLDYHSFFSFNKYAEKYKLEILRSKQITDDIVIYMIDILVGKITKIEIFGKNAIKEIVTKFDIVDKSNYTKTYFESNGKSIISKTDVYRIIEQIGVDNPGTLFEVGVFSHAYWNGPILVDSLTGHDDHDMRIDDISSSLIDLTKFKNAFVTGAFFKIWGCSFPPNTNALFSKIRKNVNYKSVGKIPDTTRFIYPKNHFLFYPTDSHSGATLPVVDLTSQINIIFKTKLTVTDIIELSFIQIKKIACFNFINTYAASLADNIDIKVQSALPATYANIDLKFHISSLTFDNVKFYENHLDVKLGELKYGIYDKITVNNLTTIFNS